MSEPAEPNRDQKKQEFPLWFRMAIIAGLFTLLAYNIFVRSDVATSLMLGGMVGAALRLNGWMNKR